MMLRKTTTIALVVLAAMAVATTTGCRAVRIADSPSVTNESKDVPLEGAARIEADVTMGVGKLSLSGETTATNALKAGFSYSPVGWKPEVSYVVAAGVGKLVVRQPDSVDVPALEHATNTWDLVLAAGVPTELTIVLGVGDSKLDLRNVDVRDLKVTTAVGETTLDLSGARTADVTVNVEAGVGDLTIRLPRSVSVRVNGREDALGDTTADGFIAQGDSWLNGAYSAAGPTIEIDLTRTIGDLNLVLVD
jgi:hypothetical protein